ncbi:MAG TPA: hypothetical protein VK553_04715 [Candidatus Nitrosopolaris rasttigaisensis]|nr:hypothetical protein [Candidatus Nitrosopolaris rasttigaisensis]
MIRTCGLIIPIYKRFGSSGGACGSTASFATNMPGFIDIIKMISITTLLLWAELI